MFGLIVFMIIIAAIVAFCLLPQLQSYRTYIFGSILTTLGGLVPLTADIFSFLDTLDWRQYLKPEHAPWAIMAIGIIVLILRKLTSRAAAAGKTV